MRTSGKTNITPGWPSLHRTGPGREKHIKRGAKTRSLARSLSLSLSSSLTPAPAWWGALLFASLDQGALTPGRWIFLLSSIENRAVTRSCNTDLSKSYNTVCPRAESCDTPRALMSVTPNLCCDETKTQECTLARQNSGLTSPVSVFFPDLSHFAWSPLLSLPLERLSSLPTHLPSRNSCWALGLQQGRRVQSNCVHSSIELLQGQLLAGCWETARSRGGCPYPLGDLWGRQSVDEGLYWVLWSSGAMEKGRHLSRLERVDQVKVRSRVL